MILRHFFFSRKFLPENGEKNGWDEKSVDVKGKFGDTVVDLISSCVCCLIFGFDKFNGCVSSWWIVLIFSRICFKLLMRQSIVNNKFSSLLLFNCFSSINESIKLRIIGIVVGFVVVAVVVDDDDDEGGICNRFDWEKFLRRFRCEVCFISSEGDSFDRGRGDIECFSVDSSIKIISFL